MNVRARVIAAVGALTLAAGCSGAGNSGFTGGYVTSDSGITRVDVDARKVAPVIEGTDLEGKKVSSADFAGKTLVVNTWGSWCAPCRKEAPTLTLVADEYADKEVQFLGVNVRDGKPDALAFERKFDVSYPSLDDYSGKSLLGLNKTLPAQGIPTTWIIDATGHVAVRIVVDGLTASTLSGLIDDVQKSVA